jgi:hypothetical protein
MPFVMPEAWGGFVHVISLSKKARSEEIVGKNASLGKDPLILATDRPLCLRLTGMPTPPIM